MIPTILIRGEITRESMGEAYDELIDYIAALSANPGGVAKDLTLVISTYGGDAFESTAFRELLMEASALHGIFIRAKIYKAYSAGAEIALVAAYREIVRTGLFGLHLGRFAQPLSRILPTEAYNLTGEIDLQVDEDTVQEMIEFEKSSLAWICQRVPSLPEEKLSKLKSTCYLELTPQECLDYGVVHAIRG